MTLDSNVSKLEKTKTVPYLQNNVRPLPLLFLHHSVLFRYVILCKTLLCELQSVLVHFEHYL